MARGGGRGRKPQVGRQGVSHPNRTDLNTPPSAEQYGDGVAVQERLDAVPIRPAPSPVPQAPRRTLTAPLPLDRPSEREWEPISTGLASGPGAGPEVLGIPDTAAATLRGWYRQFPHEEIRELIEVLEAEGR